MLVKNLEIMWLQLPETSLSLVGLGGAENGCPW